MSTVSRILKRLPKIGLLLSVAATKNHQTMENVAANLQGRHELKSNEIDSNVTSLRKDLNIFQHFKWISNTAPCFAVHGNQIRVLDNPNEFYEHLKQLSRNSKKRILLASLYFGTGEMEQELVSCIHEAAKASEAGDGDLRVKFLFDFMRGSRGEKNSRTMLLPLMKEFGSRVSVALYHTPDLRGIMKRILPERYNETVGLSHMKVYLFDDTIIMSGANLSESYFTDRQDRYVVINRCPALADFFEEIVTAVSSMSFQLRPDDSLSLADEMKCHPFLGPDGGNQYKETMKKLIEDVITRQRENNEHLGNRFLSASEIVENRTEAASHDSECSGDKDSEVDTMIFPLIQMGPFEITQDEFVTETLFKNAPSDVSIYLASGYFNLTTQYMNSIVEDCKARFEILTAAPEANGFFGSSGLSGAIPDAYTYIAKQFLGEVASSDQGHRISLYEYLKPGWTVHTKGLWYYLGGHQLPVMTMIGSPNFGYRSVFRDLEAQVVIVTQNKKLQTELHEEQSKLYDRSTKVTSETLGQPSRRIPRWVTYVTPVIRNFF